MFEESLVESTPLLRTRNRWPVFVSVATQGVLAFAILAVSLLRPELLPTQAPHLRLAVPILRHTTPPTPPPHTVHVSTSASALAAPAPAQPRTVPISQPEPAPAAPSIATDIGLGPSQPAIPTALATVASGTPTIVPRPASISGTKSASTLRVLSGVSAGLLLAPIQPTYPAMAKLTRVEGTVIVQAIISPSGHIESAHIVSGPPMLQSAALDAVRSARYRPYLLNGQPTTVETTISINFRLGD